MAQAVLKQIYSKLDEIDQKLSALLIKEEPATKEELKAIKESEKEFAQGKFKAWKEIKKSV